VVDELMGDEAIREMKEEAGIGGERTKLGETSFLF